MKNLKTLTVTVSLSEFKEYYYKISQVYNDLDLKKTLLYNNKLLGKIHSTPTIQLEAKK